jgi:hypothetical protein
MTARVTAACVFCGGAIDEDRDYQKEEGWVRRRHEGGTNALRLRRVRDEWACWVCVDRQSRGVHHAQEALV